MRNRILHAALFTMAGLGLLAAPALADNATYSPTTKSLAGTLPVNQSYILSITSPSDLNNAGDAALAGGGITVTFRASATSAPGSLTLAQADALDLVTFSPATLTFTALSQTKSVEVTVSAPIGTPDGEYSFSVQAVPPTGLAWGLGSSTLNVELSVPVVSDTTPPSVTITSPLAGTAFDFCSAGNTIAVGIDASDAESFVTAVNAWVGSTAVALSSFTPDHNVSVTGTYSATDIGAYTVSATATSAGGTSAPVTQSFSVNYTMAVLPPLSLNKTSKGGSTIPIKFSVRDCTGTFVVDERVSVEVYEGTTTPLFTAVYGDGSTNVRIDSISEHYITNFQTSSGSHNYTAKLYFNGVQQGPDINFATR